MQSSSSNDKCPTLSHLAAATTYKENRVDIRQLIPADQWNQLGNNQKIDPWHNIPASMATSCPTECIIHPNDIY